MSGSARHVLYVAWGFPPFGGSGTYRPLAAVNQLASIGARVTVLTADTHTFDLVKGSDPSLVALVDPGVKIVRIPMDHDDRDPVVNHWGADRIADTRRWTRQRSVENGQEFPEAVYLPWLRPAAAAARALHDADPFDIVVATGNPYIDFVVAMDLEAYAGVPFILDDRDAWLLDVYEGIPRANVDEYQPWFDEALARCRAMWFVNPPIARWHREHYPWAADKIDVVENGWDPLVLDLGPLERRMGRPATPTISFVGTLTPTLPVRTLAEGWRRARAQDPGLAGGQLRLVGQRGYYASNTPNHGDVERDYAADGVVFPGRIPAREVGRVYADSDVLLFAKDGGRMVTSGKIYEYLATGLPIVAATGPDTDAHRVMAGYPRLFPADASDPDSVATAMLDAFRDGASGPERRVEAAAFAARRRRGDALAAAFERWGVVES